MRPHQYFVKHALFDDEEDVQENSKYDQDGNLVMWEERRRQLQARKERVLDDSLASTKRALDMLKETEDAGITACTELAHQGDILKSVSVRLDQADADLKESHHHIHGIESIFHSLKKRITGKSKRRKQKKIKDQTDSNEDLRPKSSKNSFDSHPSTRLRGTSKVDHETPNVNHEKNKQKLIDENLDEMANHVERLKDIGINMGREIESQNQLLDRINSKAENTGSVIDGQTKRIRKIHTK